MKGPDHILFDLFKRIRWPESYQLDEEKLYDLAVPQANYQCRTPCAVRAICDYGHGFMHHTEAARDQLNP